MIGNHIIAGAPGDPAGYSQDTVYQPLSSTSSNSSGNNWLRFNSYVIGATTSIYINGIAQFIKTYQSTCIAPGCIAPNVSTVSALLSPLSPLANLTIIQALTQAGTYTTLLQLINLAGLSTTLSDTTFNQSSQYTLFAPDDTAFDLLPANYLTALQASPAQTSNLIKFHISQHSYFSVAWLVGSQFQYNLDSQLLLTVNTTNGNTTITYGNGTLTQIDQHQRNGVIHTISAVQIPTAVQSYITSYITTTTAVISANGGSTGGSSSNSGSTGSSSSTSNSGTTRSNSGSNSGNTGTSSDAKSLVPAIVVVILCVISLFI